jgi:UDP-N-acetylmuramate dehydrogenase
MRVETNKSLRPLNTFAIDAAAEWFVDVRHPDDYRAVLAEPRFATLPRFILGGGSNILLRGDVAGLVVKNSLPGISIEKQDDAHVWVRAAAGEVWHDLVLHCVEHGWGGLENLSLIPGQVGAAPMQNIGAYGVEMRDTCESVEALDARTGEAVTFSARDCEFGYRDSVFKHRYKDLFLITAVTFRLNKVPQFHVGYGDVQKTLQEMGVTDLSIRAVSDAVIRIRSSKLPDPKVLGNAGSFFKNPIVPRQQFEALFAQHPGMPHWPQRDGAEKVPAGWLIEACGWKGKRNGAVGVHERQALVIVNYGGAAGSEVWQLALEIQASVRDRFGIELHPEVNLI